MVFQSTFILSSKVSVCLLLFFSINSPHLAIFTAKRDKQGRRKSTCGVFQLPTYVLEFFLPTWSKLMLLVIICKAVFFCFILQIRKLSLKSVRLAGKFEFKPRTQTKAPWYFCVLALPHTSHSHICSSYHCTHVTLPV